MKNIFCLVYYYKNPQWDFDKKEYVYLRQWKLFKRFVIFEDFVSYEKMLSVAEKWDKQNDNQTKFHFEAKNILKDIFTFSSEIKNKSLTLKVENGRLCYKKKDFQYV